MSEIRATTISDAAGTGPITLTKQSAAKAWMTMTGDGSAIDDSFATSSLIDVAAGEYIQIYTNSFSNANYSWIGQQESTYSTTAVIIAHMHSGKTSSETYILTYNAGAGAAIDTEENCTVVFGDLA